MKCCHLLFCRLMLANLGLGVWLAAGADAATLVNLQDIPHFPDGPGKGHYAIFQGKRFEVLLTTNLDAMVYPLIGGQRTDKPILIENYLPKPLKDLQFVSIVAPAPPTRNPSKLVFELVSDKGLHLLQTWTFTDGVLTVMNQMNGYTDLPPVLRTGIHFPRLRTFADNVPLSLRTKATEGCVMRWRAGKAENAMRVFTVPYASRLEYVEHCDWMEHTGPWGTRKVTLKRTSQRGIFQVTNPSEFVAHGLVMHFISRSDARKRVESQGFELKVE